MPNMIQENICEIQTYLLLNMTNCDLNVVVLVNKWVSGGIVIVMPIYMASYMMASYGHAHHAF
jgi:hypothetical protein